MNIAIIGTGNIGGALARLWLAHGHEIALGVRSEDKIQSTQAEFPGASAALVGEVVRAAEVVVLAVPWPAVEQVLGEMGSLAGKVLIDTTNPVRSDLSGLESLGGKSAADIVQQGKPEARVVKAFNTVGATYLGNGRVGNGDADGFYCGDDPEAKSIAAKLIEQAGLVPADCGPLRNARYLEALAMLWIDMAFGHRRGQRFAFKLLTETDGAAA
jgi:NADPH-dependent F420 reductase